MKSLIKAAVIASVLAVPALSFAQSDAPLTRAQVQADLVQFEQSAPRGAFGRDPYYPVSAQAAETRIASANGNTVAVGGVSNNGSSASGSRADVKSGPNSIYFGQ
jgi:Domain of unknown function (DUF4148)